MTAPQIMSVPGADHHCYVAKFQRGKICIVCGGHGPLEHNSNPML